MSLEPLKAQSGSHSPAEPKSSAVDAKGVRHQMSDYGEGRAPWDADMIKFVKPDYPAEYRARHAEGTGFFRITLDATTGGVTNVAVLKSTGFSGLDDVAVKAIRLWRWRPLQWKEIDMPVTFTMRPRGHHTGSAREIVARGTAYYQKGDNKSATKAFDEAIHLQPSLAEAYIMRGSAYQAEGQRDKALADFNEAIRLDPRSARAYCDRAILENELSQPVKALADYDEAIRLAPDFRRSYFDRGAYFTDRHNYERAISDFTRAIQLMPDDFNAYGQRAYAYAKQGDRARAAADANIAIKLQPREFYLWHATDLWLRAEAYRILNRAELALRDLCEAVRIAPKKAGMSDELAWFLATCPEDRFRNGAEAVSVAKNACELSHWQHSGCYDTLAVAYTEAGDFDQAVKYEKQALNDSSLAPKEREEREKRLALFEERKPFREDLAAHP
jgi:TonB family protein